MVKIDTRISPRGWKIYFLTEKKGDRLKLRNLLKRLEITFEEGDWFMHDTRFDYDENLEEIRPVVQELIDKIATS